MDSIKANKGLSDPSNEINISQVVSEEVLKFLNDSMKWGEHFESLKQKDGYCSPSHRESFNEVINKQFKITLDLMKKVEPNTDQFKYCTEMIGLYENYYEDDQRENF